MAEQTVTPWKVEAPSNGEKVTAIDYDHIITQFGCQKYTENHTKLLQDVTGQPIHRFLRRGLAFAHRDFDKILECIRKKESFYLYTGRGPSSGSMHIGHSIPFLICKYFQEVFDVPVIIQMTDDEKFLCKDITLGDARKFCAENIKDVIAFGFDPSKTYIFSNYDSSHIFLHNTLKLSKIINLNEAMKVFGFDLNTPIGLIDFPARQIAVAYSSSFSFLPQRSYCLIPAAVDQDPYFRLARDKAFAMDEHKPASLYVQLLPDLQGVNRKMSASDSKSSIFLSDDPETIRDKIKKWAFSGGQKTKALHQELGGDPDVDVAYQYLRFFLEDDEELERISVRYRKGEIFTSEIKNRSIEVIQKFIQEFQERRSAIDTNVISRFMDIKQFK